MELLDHTEVKHAGLVIFGGLLLICGVILAAVRFGFLIWQADPLIVYGAMIAACGAICGVIGLYLGAK